MELLSYFDSFDFRRKKQNARQTIFRGLTVLFFILAENFTDRQFRRRFSIKLDKILRIMILEKHNERNEWLAHNKNYISIGVSVRTTKFVARNNGIGVRQESNPQLAIEYSSER